MSQVFFLSVASDHPTVTSRPLSAMFSLLAQTSIYANDCRQSVLSKKRLIKNKFCICMTKKTPPLPFTRCHYLGT